VSGDIDGNIFVYTSSDGVSWIQYWNFTQDDTNNMIQEIVVGDLDRDGYEDDFVTVDRYGGHIFAFNGSGSLIFNTSDMGTIIAVEVLDLNGDGFRDDILAGDLVGNRLLAYNYNGSMNVTYTSPNLWEKSSVGDIREIRSIDFDGDGFRDDIVVA